MCNYDKEIYEAARVTIFFIGSFFFGTAIYLIYRIHSNHPDASFCALLLFILTFTGMVLIGISSEMKDEKYNE